MQRVLPVLLFFLLVFGAGVMLGVQAPSGHALLPIGLGISALLPVVLAYLAAGRRVVPGGS